MNRTQGVVLGFFALVWVSRVVILVVAPEVYDQASPAVRGRGAEFAFLAALSGFVGCLSSA